jgi:hypothetical protein
MMLHTAARHRPNWFMLATFLWTIAFSLAAHSQEVSPPELKIIDPYIELHTGPGRSFPVFYVAKRGEWVTVLRRKTDWYEVGIPAGQSGWVSREQLAGTLKKAGEPRRLRDIFFDQYLTQRLEAGMSMGLFENQSLTTIRGQYMLSHFLTGELSYAFISGDFNSSRLTSACLNGHPFNDWRYAPYFSLGVGQLEDTPRTTLLQPITSSSRVFVSGIGIRTYLTRRFIMRADFRNYVVVLDDNTTREFQELSGGFAFTF